MFTYHAAPADTVRLGLIVLQADETIEADMRTLLGDHAPFVTRVPSGAEVTSETLQAMEGQITQAARLLPGSQVFDAVGYGCTSGAAQIGPGRVADLVRAGLDATQVTDPLSALVAACHHLKIRRLALLSPYVAEVSDSLRKALTEHDIETPVFGSFDEAVEEKVVRIEARSIHDAALSLCADQEVDAIFLSCTNLRTLTVIDPLEAALDMPVLSSNQVLAWHMAQAAGVPAKGPGRLLQTP